MATASMKSIWQNGTMAKAGGVALCKSAMIIGASMRCLIFHFRRLLRHLMLFRRFRGAFTPPAYVDFPRCLRHACASLLPPRSFVFASELIFVRAKLMLSCRLRGR